MTEQQEQDGGTTPQKTSADEVLGTLTGYDEIAIAKKFGDEVLDLMERKPLTGLRALVYIQKRRELTTPHTKQAAVDQAAYDAVMEMTVMEIQDLISDEDEDSTSGEGSPQPA
jgi:hypothetical protein